MYIELTRFRSGQRYYENYGYYNISLLFHKLMCEYARECGIPFETDVNYNVSRSEAKKLTNNTMIFKLKNGRFN